MEVEYSSLTNVPWFVGWGTLSLIVAGLAQGKNRNGCAWLFLALLFGPFALFCLLFLANGRCPYCDKK